MRIAFMGRALAHTGGIGRYARSLLAAMAETATDEIVVAANRGDVEVPHALRTVRSQRSSVPAVLYWEQVELPRVMKREGIDVFVNPDFTLPVACPCPGVIAVHDVAYALLPGYASRRARLYYAAFVGRSVRSAAAVVTLSDFSRAAIVRYFGVDRRKVIVARPAVDAHFRPNAAPGDDAVRAQLGLSRDYILYVGLLGGYKNVPGLIAAYEGIPHDARPDLVIAWKSCGDTPAILIRARRSIAARHIRVLPDVSDAALPALYRGAKLFVFPSLYEGFGLPPLEAMASGVPVICTSAAALPEAAGDAAVLVAPGDDEALTHAIRRVLGSITLRHELTRRGLDRVRHFSWRDTAGVVLGAVHDARRQARGACPVGASR